MSQYIHPGWIISVTVDHVIPRLLPENETFMMTTPPVSFYFFNIYMEGNGSKLVKSSLLKHLNWNEFSAVTQQMCRSLLGISPTSTSTLFILWHIQEIMYINNSLTQGYLYVCRTYIWVDSPKRVYLFQLMEISISHILHHRRRHIINTFSSIYHPSVFHLLHLK